MGDSPSKAPVRVHVIAPGPEPPGPVSETVPGLELELGPGPVLAALLPLPVCTRRHLPIADVGLAHPND